MAGKFELKVAKNGEIYFNLLAENGDILLKSEMYKTKASATNGIESVKKNADDASRFERLESSNAKQYFVLKAGNHQIIGQSSLYASADERDAAIASLQALAADAAVADLTA